MKLLAVLTCLVAFASATFNDDYHSIEIFFQSLSPLEVQSIVAELEAEHGTLPENVALVLANNPHFLPPDHPTTQPTQEEEEEVIEFEGSEKFSKGKLIKITHTVKNIKKKQEIQKKNFVPKKLSSKRKGKPCNVDDDCPYMHVCIQVEKDLEKRLKDNNATEHTKFVKKRLDVGGNECVKRSTQFTKEAAPGTYPKMQYALQKISKVINKTAARKEEGFKNFGKTFSFVHSFNMKEKVIDPVTRHGEITYQGGQGGLLGGQGGLFGGMDPMMMLFLFGGLMDDGGDDDGLLDFILLSSLTSGGGGGMGGILENPLLLISILGDGGIFGGGDGDGDSDGMGLMTLLLLTSFGEGAGGNALVLPLLLGLLGGDGDNSDEDDGLSGLLPLLLIGGIGGGSGQCTDGSGQNSLMQYLLYSSLLGGDEEENGIDSSMLIFFLIGGGNGCGAGGSMIELLLLGDLFDTDSEGGAFGGLDPLSLLLLTSGIGSEGGGFDPIVLLLSMSSGMNVSTLLPFLFMSDSSFASNPLFALLFFGDMFEGDLFGGGLGSLLILSLAFSQGDMGYTGQETYQVQPHPMGVGYADIPRAGPAASQGTSYQVNHSGHQAHSSGGLFGGMGNGGLFEIFILMSLLGGGDDGDEGGMDILSMFMFINILSGTGGGLFSMGGSQTGYDAHSHYDNNVAYYGPGQAGQQGYIGQGGVPPQGIGYQQG